MRKVIGILPAGGEASRLRPLRYPKELLPIAFESGPGRDRLRPIPVAEFSLRALRRARIRQCCIVIADWKTELVKYFGDGSDLDLSIAYVNQQAASGLPQAIDLCFPWIEEAVACLCLPDTVFEPHDSVEALLRDFQSQPSDLMLGIFPTACPERLGPVRLMEDGTVAEVLDKPRETNLRNTWGVALWSPKFSILLHETIAYRHGASTTLGDYFQLAIECGLRVRGRFFPAGYYHDVGVPEGLADVVFQGEA
jgi:glucose-1-phosphate thymidylyltransferase